MASVLPKRKSLTSDSATPFNSHYLDRKRLRRNPVTFGVLGCAAHTLSAKPDTEWVCKCGRIKVVAEAGTQVTNSSSKSKTPARHDSIRYKMQKMDERGAISGEAVLGSFPLIKGRTVIYDGRKHNRHFLAWRGSEEPAIRIVGGTLCTDFPLEKHYRFYSVTRTNEATVGTGPWRGSNGDQWIVDDTLVLEVLFAGHTILLKDLKSTSAQYNYVGSGKMGANNPVRHDPLLKVLSEQASEQEKEKEKEKEQEEEQEEEEHYDTEEEGREGECNGKDKDPHIARPLKRSASLSSRIETCFVCGSCDHLNKGGFVKCTSSFHPKKKSLYQCGDCAVKCAVERCPTVNPSHIKEMFNAWPRACPGDLFKSGICTVCAMSRIEPPIPRDPLEVEVRPRRVVSPLEPPPRSSYSPSYSSSSSSSYSKKKTRRANLSDGTSHKLPLDTPALALERTPEKEEAPQSLPQKEIEEVKEEEAEGVGEHEDARAATERGSWCVIC